MSVAAHDCVDRVATIRMQDPARRNILTSHMLEGLTSAFDQFLAKGQVQLSYAVNRCVG